MNCKIEINTFKNLLDKTEFDSYKEFTKEINTLKEKPILYKKGKNKFRGKILNITANLRLEIELENSPRLLRVLPETIELNEENKPSEITPTGEVGPTFEAEYTDPIVDPVEEEPIEDLTLTPEDQLIKWEQYQSTTSQDLETEINGKHIPLKERRQFKKDQLNQDQRALKEEIMGYTLVGLQDGPDIRVTEQTTNEEESQTEYGQVLLAIPNDKVHLVKDRKSAIELSYTIQDRKVPLNFEGSLEGPSRTFFGETPGADRTKGTHDKRILIRQKYLLAEGLEVTTEEVAAMFEAEYQKLQADREEIKNGKLKFYKPTKVSKGHYFPSDRTLLEMFDPIYTPSNVRVHFEGTYKGKITATIDGKQFILVPRLFTAEELEMVSSMAGRQLTPQEQDGLKLLLGDSKKGYHIHNNKLYYQGQEATPKFIESDLLTRRVFISNTLVRSYNENPDNNIAAIVPETDPKAGTYNQPSPINVNVETYFLSRVSLGFEFFILDGQLVSDPANKYVYFNEVSNLRLTEPRTEFSVQDLLSKLEIVQTDPQFKEAFERREVPMGFEVKDANGNVIDKLTPQRPATTSFYDGKIIIYTTPNLTDDLRLEEELHATTGYAMLALMSENPNHPLVKELERLLEKARIKYQTSQTNDELIHYSLYGHRTKKPSNEQEALIAKLEFLARGLSHEGTRNFLRQIKDDKNLLEQLRDLVVKVLNYLGLEIEPNVYGSLVKLNTELLLEFDIEQALDLNERYVPTETPQPTSETIEDIQDIDDIDDLFDGVDMNINLGAPGEFSAQDRQEIAQTLDYLFINMIYSKSSYTLNDLVQSKKENLSKTVDAFGGAMSNIRKKLIAENKSPNLVKFLSLYLDKETHLLYKNIWFENSEVFSAEVLEDTDELIQELKDEGKISGRDFSYDGNEINHLKHSSSVTKLLFKSIERVENGRRVVSKFGTYKLADYKKLFYKTLKLTQGSSTYSEMLDRIASSEDLQVKRILDRLPVYKDDSGWVIKPGDPNTVINRNEQMVLQVFQDLRKPDLDYYTLKRFEDKDGNKYEFLLELNSKTTKIKEGFFTKLRTKESPYFELDEYNQPRAKESLLPAAKSKLDNKDWKGFFDLLGIEFSDKSYADPEFQKELIDLESLIPHIYRHLEILVTNGLTDPYKQLSNDFKKSKGFHSRLTKLVDVESKYSQYTANYTIRNAAGNLIQGNSLPNSMTFLLQEGNKLTQEEYDGLMEVRPNEAGYHKKRLLGNFFSNAFQYSRTKKKTFGRRRREIEFLAYGGLNQDENLITADLTISDWLKMQINTTLKEGTSEIMRAETLTSAWAWRIKGMNRNELWVSDKKDFMDQMLDYLKGELVRISLAQNMPDFKYYNKELSLMKGIVNLDTNDIKGLSREEIEQYVKDNSDTFRKQIDTWYRQEYAKLTEYTANFTEADIDAGIREKYNNKLDIIWDNFLMNDIIYNIETSIVLYGGVEWYKDFHKRAKGMLSTGQIAPIDESYWNQRTRENTLTGLYGHTDPFSWIFNSANLQEDVAKSTFAEEIKTEAINSYIKRMTALGETVTRKQAEERLGKKITNYEEMEIGDGQGWCTIDFYREFLNSVGNWSEADELLYKREVAFFKKFEKGMTLTEEEEALLATEPKNNFTSLKVSYFGTTDVFPDINPQIFDKFSLSPIVPSAVYGKKLSQLNHRMLEADISYVKMTTGTKVAQRTKGEGPMAAAPFFDSDRNLIVPNLQSFKYKLYLPYLKEQIKTDSKVKQKTIASTQKRKLLVSDLKELGVYIDLEWTPKLVGNYHGISHQAFGKLTRAKKFELIKAYQDSIAPTFLHEQDNRYKELIDAKTNLLKIELYEELGLEETPRGIKIKSVKFFLEALKKELKTRDLNNAVKDFLDLKIKEDIPFEVSTNKQSLQNLIQGIINKKLVRQKVNGSQLIQVAPTGYETLGSTLSLFEPYTPTGKEKPFPNNAQYGIKSSWQQKAGKANSIVGKQAKSTHEAILLGLRTGTSRTSTQGIKVGEIINVGKTGSPIYAKVTKVYDKTLKQLLDSGEMTAKEWSQREGWSEEYISDNPQVLNKYPIDFQVLNTEKTGVTGLKFYTLKDGKTQAAETKVGMVGKWKPLLNRQDVKQKAEREGITRLEALNKLIKDQDWLEKNIKLITYTGERIPVQGLNSMEYFIVEEFLPSTVGPIIIPPAELVIKSGGDYDIDKETIQIPTFSITGEYINSYEAFTSKDARELSHWREQYYKLKEELSKLNNVPLQVFYEQIDFIQDQYREYVNQFGHDIEFKARLDEEIAKIEAQMQPLIERNKPYNELKELLFRVNRERMKLEEKKFNHFAYLDNSLIEVASNILSHELNYHQLVTPNATDRISGHLRTIGSNIHDSQEDPKNSDIIKTTTNIAKRKSLLTNPRLLGIVAVSNTFLQQYNSINAVINKMSGLGQIDNLLLTEQEKNEISGEDVWHIASQLDLNGILKSEIGSQTINATVDGAKEDYLGDANYNMHNMGMIMYLHLWGVPVERISNFINQPVIYEYYKLTEMADNEVRKSYASREYDIDYGEFYLTQRNALLTRMFMSATGQGSLREVKYYLKKKENRTSLEEKILNSLDGNKLKPNNKLELIWKKDLILPTPEFKAKDASKEMVKDIETQVITLVHYLNLIDQAGAVFNIQSRHNYDTQTTQSPLHAREKKNLDETIREQNFMPQGTIRALKNTITRSFNVQSLIEDVFEQVFSFNYQKYFLERATNSQLKNNRKELKDRYYRTLSNDLIEWVLKRRAFVGDQQLGPYIDDLLLNFNKEYKEKVKDPRFKDLALVQNMLLKPVGNRTYFYLLQDSGSTIEQNIYIENLETINQIDPEFAKKLALIGFGQTGFNKTYFSWAEIIPPSMLKDILLPAFKEPLSNQDIQDFMAEFVKFNPMFYSTSSTKPNMEVKYTTERKLSVDKTYRGLLNRDNMPANGVFVFGSNPVGINGNPQKNTGGAALVASREFGVFQGEKMNNKRSASSRAYGLVTVKYPGQKKSLTLEEIRANVETFFEHASENPELRFYVAYDGINPEKTSLNGYTANEMASVFYGAPENVIFEENFVKLIPEVTEARINTGFTNYSGAAKGADSYWAIVGTKYGVRTVEFVPETLSKLNEAQTEEVEQAYQKAAKQLGRKVLSESTYAGKLVRRDYLQAKGGDAIFAVSKILNPGEKDKKGYTIKSEYQVVEGGTGYAVQMGINLNKPVYVFDQEKESWFQWNYKENKFEKISEPQLTPKFAGIGTRDLQDSGKRAIESIYKNVKSKEVKQLWKESLTVFRGKKVENQDITNNEGEAGGARTDYKNNIIRVNYDRLWSMYNKKQWVVSRPLSDGSRVEPLDFRHFQSYREWLTFVILHEYHHFGNPKLPNETLGQYETRINKLALEDLNHNFDTQPGPLKDYRVEVSPEIAEQIQRLVEQADYIVLDKSEDFYINLRTGETYERATHYINKGRPEQTPLLESSQKIGTAIDGLVRDYFQGILKPYNEYFTKEGQWVGKDQLFASEELYNSFVKELDDLARRFKKTGEQVIANDVRVFHRMNSERDGVAGTLDILTVDEEGRVRIYDLKSKRSGLDFIHSQTYGKTDFVKWSEQLNLYRIMMYNQNGLLANELNVLPIKVYYKEGTGTTTQATFLKDLQIPVLANVREAKIEEKFNLGATPDEKPKTYNYTDYHIADEPFYGSFDEDNKTYNIIPLTEPIDFFTAMQRGYGVPDYNGKKIVHKVVLQSPEINFNRQKDVPIGELNTSTSKLTIYEEEKKC